MWDLKYAIREGMEHMTRSFDKDGDMRPWFEIRLEEGKPGYMFHFPGLDVPHAPGRCLDAMLMGEAVTGIPADDVAVALFKKWLMISMDAPDGLVGDWGEEGRFVRFHNFREGLEALNALVRYRNDEWALEAGTEFVKKLDALLGVDGCWKHEKMDELSKQVRVNAPLNLPATHEGRLVYALLLWHHTTGQQLALDMAGRIVPYTLRVMFDAEGNRTPNICEHVHSVTSTFSSAADYYCLTNDKIGMASLVPAFFKTILPLGCRSGWMKENTLPTSPYIVGETNSTGDIIQACLCMGKVLEDDTYYAIAEEMLRSHLLPAQVFPEDIPENWRIQAGEGDVHADIAQRMRGGFGFPLPSERAPLNYNQPYCRITTLDITAGSVQAICRCVMEGVERDQNSFRVNLLVDAKQPGFSLKQTALNTWVVESFLPINMRLPKNNGVMVNGEALIAEGRLHLRPGRYEIRLDLTDTWEEELLFGQPYKTRWIGEQAVDMLPRGEVSDMFAKLRPAE